MQYIQPKTTVYHITETLMGTENVSSNAVKGTKNTIIGNHLAR